MRRIRYSKNEGQQIAIITSRLQLDIRQSHHWVKVYDCSNEDTQGNLERQRCSRKRYDGYEA